MKSSRLYQFRTLPGLFFPPMVGNDASSVIHEVDAHEGQQLRSLISNFQDNDSQSAASTRTLRGNKESPALPLLGSMRAKEKMESLEMEFVPLTPHGSASVIIVEKNLSYVLRANQLRGIRRKRWLATRRTFNSRVYAPHRAISCDCAERR